MVEMHLLSYVELLLLLLSPSEMVGEKGNESSPFPLNLHCSVNVGGRMASSGLRVALD